MLKKGDYAQRKHMHEPKNRIERWLAGDKSGLWREVMEEDARRRDKKNKKGGMSKDEREQRVGSMAE